MAQTALLTSPSWNLTSDQPENHNNFFAELKDFLYSFTTAAALETKSAPTFLTEALSSDDPRSRNSKVLDAVKAEVKGLMDRKTFKKILKEDIPEDANVLPGQFVLLIKSTQDGSKTYKAPFITGEHRDKLKRPMVHFSQTMQPSSIRLTHALALNHNFDVWTSDVRQAYFQSSKPLSRDVLLKDPPPKFKLRSSQVLQLLKPLYGLCESGDLWYKTPDEHHRLDLGISLLHTDPALYFKLNGSCLTGLSGSYVDDMLRAGTQEFHGTCFQTHKRFDMSNDEPLPCEFSVFEWAKVLQF